MPRIESRLRFIEHIEARGVDLFRVACGRDLEGVVGKWAPGSYRADSRASSWVKIKNPTYSQMEGRAELFDRRTVEGVRRSRQRRPDLALR